MHSLAPRGNFRATCRKVLTLSLGIGLAAGLLCVPARRAAAQVVVSSGVRIGQIYTRGGEPGATYSHDFIELFNAGPSTVDLNDWSLHITGVNGSPSNFVTISLASSRSILIGPGQYRLLKLGGSRSGGAPLPAPDHDLVIFDGLNDFLNMSGTRGQIALLRKNAAAPPRPPVCPSLPADGIEDYVGYGTATCFEGSAPSPAPSQTTALKRLANGCADAGHNAADFLVAAPSPRNTSTPPFPCAPAGGQSVIQFGLPQFNASEIDGHAQVIVTRTGDTSGPATVDYLAADGTASERRDYTTTLGTLRFAPGEQTKSFDVLLNGDAYVEGNETVNLVLANPTGGAALGFRTAATLVIHDGLIFTPPPADNPADNTRFFVEQHYHDFLNREADAGGLQFWSDGIEACGADAECRRRKRVDTSAAFFLSIEFQETGYFVYRAYKAALPERAFRPRALPRYREFVRDTQEIGRGVVVGLGDWEARLAANKREFLDAFVARPEFAAQYPATLTPAGYVDALNAQAGGMLSAAERDALVEALTSGAETRATALGRVADDPDFVRAEFNRAFVLMQYFGYLRRSPDDPEDNSFDGYDFWLRKLEESGGDWRRAEMVRAFIESIEYRQRFGQ